jgi:nucleoid-associated protein YgaU
LNDPSLSNYPRVEAPQSRPLLQTAAESNDSPVSLAPEPAATTPSPVQGTPAPAQPIRAQPTKPGAASIAGRRHVVVKGDTLFSLAQKYYGNRSRWRDIYAANRDVLPSENSLQLGMEIKIP